MFSERNDRHTRNGGTSAACAMAAGVVAALREGWGTEVVPPSEMKQLLRETAWRPGKPRWDGRLGYGIVNSAGMISELGARYSSKSAPMA